MSLHAMKNRDNLREEPFDNNEEIKTEQPEETPSDKNSKLMKKDTTTTAGAAAAAAGGQTDQNK